MRAGINKSRNNFRKDEKETKGAVRVVVNIAPATQKDTKWNRPNHKRPKTCEETRKTHTIFLAVCIHTRSEFIHTYYDEGTRILGEK